MFLRKVLASQKADQHVADEKKLPHNTSTGRTSPMFCTGSGQQSFSGTKTHPITAEEAIMQ